mgnify:CR=1 FL=1
MARGFSVLALLLVLGLGTAMETSSNSELKVEPRADQAAKVNLAQDAFLKGWTHYLRSTPRELVMAEALFKEAIALDADYGPAYAGLASTYWLASQRFWEMRFGFNWKWARVLTIKLLETAQKAPTAIAHQLASSIYIVQRRYAESIGAARRAIELDSNSVEAYRALAYALIMSGQPAEARKTVERVQRLDPRAAGRNFFLLGLIAFTEGNLEQAASLIERAREHVKDAQFYLPPLIAAYVHLGRDDEARTMLKIYYDWFSTHSTELSSIMYFWPFKDNAVAARLANGLLLAGIQGKPGGFYNVSDEHRLTGPEIAGLFKKFGRAWKIYDVRAFGQYPMDLTDLFRKDGTVVRKFEGWSGGGDVGINFEWIGQYRIDGDLLCIDFQRAVVGGLGCRPVFRSTDIARRANREYIIVGALGFYEFSPAD